MVLLWSAVACVGEPPEPSIPETPPPEDGAVGLGWVGQVGFHPEDFAALTATHREGWVALHANDAVAAWEAFGPADAAGATRAALVEGSLHADLAALTARVHDTLWTRWRTRAGSHGAAPLPDAGRWVAALASVCAGPSAYGLASGPETAPSWVMGLPPGPDSGIANAIAGARDPFPVEADGPVGRRLALHRAAMEARDPQHLLAAAADPLFSETAASPGATAFDRRFWDPCVDATLARVWFARAADVEGSADPRSSWRTLPALRSAPPLAATFLAPWPTPEDLATELRVVPRFGELGARTTAIGRLGVSPALAPSDDADLARAQVRALDAGLDAWSAKIADQAPADGAALVRDLGLVRVFRQAWLLARARTELSAKHPATAAVLLGAAEDRDRPGVGPGNPPSLYVLMAEAELAGGHLREALGAFHTVAVSRPELHGLEETLSDLVVLEGLGKPGDSKEDP